MTTEELMSKWSDLLVAKGGEIRIVGALKIHEPENIMYDLRQAGYESSGKHPEILNNGSRLYRRWRPCDEPTEREKLTAAGLVPANVDDQL